MTQGRCLNCTEYFRWDEDVKRPLCPRCGTALVRTTHLKLRNTTDLGVRSPKTTGAA